MRGTLSLFVTPAKAGVQTAFERCDDSAWIPAFAGMTDWCSFTRGNHFPSSQRKLGSPFSSGRSSEILAFARMTFGGIAAFAKMMGGRSSARGDHASSSQRRLGSHFFLLKKREILAFARMTGGVSAPPSTSSAARPGA